MQTVSSAPKELIPLFEILPEEMFCEVLSYITQPKDYANASLACKFFRRILLEPKFHLISRMLTAVRPHLSLQAKDCNPAATPNGEYRITLYFNKNPFSLAAVQGFGTNLKKCEKHFDLLACAVTTIAMRYWPEGGSLLNLLDIPIIKVESHGRSLERLSAKIQDHLQNMAIQAVAYSKEHLPEEFQDIPKFAWLGIIANPLIDLSGV